MAEIKLIKVEKRDNFALVFGFVAGSEEGLAVMKGEADQLLTARDDFGIAEGTGFCKR